MTVGSLIMVGVDLFNGMGGLEILAVSVMVGFFLGFWNWLNFVVVSALCADWIEPQARRYMVHFRSIQWASLMAASFFAISMSFGFFISILTPVPSTYRLASLMILMTL